MHGRGPGIFVPVVQFQCRLLLWVQALIFGDPADVWVVCFVLFCALPRALQGLSHVKLGVTIVGCDWERSGHQLTSRPVETAGVRFLSCLLSVFCHPESCGAALLEGGLPLQYCDICGPEALLVDRHVRTLLTCGGPDVGLVDVVPVASGRLRSWVLRMCVAGRGLSGLTVLEVFGREYDSQRTEFPTGVHLCLFQILTGAGGRGFRWWVVLTKWMVVMEEVLLRKERSSSRRRECGEITKGCARSLASRNRA